MKTTDLVYPISILLVAGISSFLGAYLVGKPIIPPQPDLSDLKKLEIISKQLTELQKNHQTLATSLQSLSNNPNQSQEILLAKLQAIETKLNNTSPQVAQSNVAPIVSTPSTENKTNKTPEIPISKQIDHDALQTVTKDMYSTDFNTRQRALRAMVLLGSPEIKQQIGQIILNEDENVALRRDLIQSMDWQGLGDQLVGLFEKSKDSAIRFAAISAVDSSNLSETEKQSFENSLLNNVTVESDDFIKIATLDYFSNHNREQLQSVINKLNPQEISPQLQDHIKFLTTPSQETPASNNSG
jgi:hypothetical protein